MASAAMRARRLTGLLVALIALAVPACDRGAALTADLVTRADLDRIVLSPADALPGTSYVDAVSGYQDLEAFARDAVELGKLRADGFVVGHLAFFVPTGHEQPGVGGPLAPDDVLIQGITGLFETPTGAESALERFVDDLRTRQIPDAVDEPAPGLGEPEFALRGRTPDGATVLLYAWRQRNLVLALSGSGDVGDDDVLSLARLVHDRTASV